MRYLARTVSALLLLVGANLMWAGQGVAIKLLSGELGPLAIALLPFYGVTALGFCLLLLRPGFAATAASAWRSRDEFFLAGIAGQFVAQVGMTLGVTWSFAANGAILSLLIPVLSALIATWLLKERLSSLRLGSLFLGVCGVLILSPRTEAAGAPLHPLAGNLLITAGCLGSAFYNVYSKRLLDRFSGLEILFFSYLATAVFGLPVLALFEPCCLFQFAHLGAGRWFAFGYLSIFLYGVSMALFLRALRYVDVIVASASLYLVPLFGVCLAVAVLHERLAPRAILGSAIVVLATLILFRFDGRTGSNPGLEAAIILPPEPSHPLAERR